MIGGVCGAIEIPFCWYCAVGNIDVLTYIFEGVGFKSMCLSSEFLFVVCCVLEGYLSLPTLILCEYPYFFAL